MKGEKCLKLAKNGLKLAQNQQKKKSNKKRLVEKQLTANRAVNRYPITISEI
jgi:hypothetical protein